MSDLLNDDAGEFDDDDNPDEPPTCCTGEGCETCAAMGLCPHCGSASPGRCGCTVTPHEDDEEA